jgi:hypothetical protein
MDKWAESELPNPSCKILLVGLAGYGGLGPWVS